MDSILSRPDGLRASWRRITALILRYSYLIRGSWARVISVIYWPFLQMVMWGFLQLHLAENSSLFARASGVLIGSVLLWDILFRGKIGFSVCFLEEIWSRNIGPLMLSPIRTGEFIVALSLMSIIRLAVGVIPVTILANVFFGFNLLGLGLALGAFFANLILTSWALALFSSGVVLRYGLGAEELAWSLAFVLLPICCVYYPVAILPDWLQPVALALPPTHVFEGMRALILDGVFDAGAMWWALGLNAVLLGIGYACFRCFLRSTRVNGSLLTLGE